MEFSDYIKILLNFLSIFNIFLQLPLTEMWLLQKFCKSPICKISDSVFSRSTFWGRG